MRFQHYLFKPIDNTPIVLWRVVFGLVMFFETWGAIAVGWVKQVYLDPPLFTFNFIGFEFLQPLPGYVCMV
jgi:vitamin K-dependent gamma-carboxylase